MRTAALLAICLLAIGARANWTSWTLATGGAPGLWDDDGRVALVTRLPEGLALLLAGVDGSQPQAVVGARSPRPDVVLAEGDLSRSLEMTEDGSYAVVGDRLLVSLSGSGAIDLAAQAGETLPLLDAAIAPDTSCVAVVTSDGRLLAATREWGPELRVVETARATGVSLANGAVALIHTSDGRHLVLDAATGETLAEVPDGGPCALSANGRRLAYGEGDALVRLDLDRGESDRMALPRPADAVALDQWGGRAVLRTGARLLTCTWGGDELRPVADCDAGAAFSLSPSGGTVAYTSGGAMHIASFARGAPPEVQPLRVERLRESPDLLHPLAGLRGLAERIASESRPDNTAAGLVARDEVSGWGVYRSSDPPFSLRVPPEWTAEPCVGGVRLTSPDETTVVTVEATRLVPLAPQAWLVWRDPEAKQVPCLLGGAPGLSIEHERDGRLEACYAAKWATGIVMLEVLTSEPAVPQAARIVIESLCLEPWQSAE